MKAFRIKFALRFLAMLDVLFAERFELTKYKGSRKTGETTFCKKEINIACRKGLIMQVCNNNDNDLCEQQLIKGHGCEGCNYKNDC